MLYAIIDVDSNSIRMTIFRWEDGKVDMLLNKKSMAGLAGYVEKGKLNEAGIKKCSEEIASFVKLAKNVEVDGISIIATASLRNISNLEEVQAALESRCGLRAQVLTGQEEARLDFVGASRYLSVDSGVLIDIGGGSTELVLFEKGSIRHLTSLPIGSLNLYAQYASALFPTEKDRKRMKARIQKELKAIDWLPPTEPVALCGIGGTARGFFKICRELYGVPKCQNELDASYIGQVNKKLKSQDIHEMQSIFRAVPDRVFTILPGMMILHQAAKKFGAQRFLVSKPGLREGYLFDRVLPQVQVSASNVTD